MLGIPFEWLPIDFGLPQYPLRPRGGSRTFKMNRRQELKRSSRRR
jgi:hypothetical protein